MFSLSESVRRPGTGADGGVARVLSGVHCGLIEDEADEGTRSGVDRSMDSMEVIWGFRK